MFGNDGLFGIDRSLAADAPLAAADVASLPTPTGSSIPTALANTHATILNSLHDLQHDLGLGRTRDAEQDRPRDATTSVGGSTPSVPPPPPDDPQDSGGSRNRWQHADSSRWGPDSPAHNSDAAYAASHASPPLPPQAIPCNREHLYDVEEISPRGGMTPTPCQRLTLLKDLDPHILQWHAGLPAGDPIDGAKFMESNDVEALGIDPAFAPEMAEEHLDHVEHWTNPRWAAHDTRLFGGSSYTPSSLAGPPIMDILKQISNWEKLSDLSATGWQAFYKKLR